MNKYNLLLNFNLQSQLRLIFPVTLVFIVSKLNDGKKAIKREDVDLSNRNINRNCKLRHYEFPLGYRKQFSLNKHVLLYGLHLEVIRCNFL